MSTIQIPLIFDVSANGIVYGEDISGDAITNHLKLKLTPTVAQSTAFINAFKKILYADPSDNAATDGSGVFFFRTGDPWDAIGDSIKNFFFGTTEIKHEGSNASDRFTAFVDPSGGTQYGIPIGVRQTSTIGGNTTGTWYNDPFIDGDGTEFHKILIRVAAAHLMGHPFSQAFIQENTIKSDLENCDISGQINTHMKLSTLNTAAAGDVVQDSNGVQVPALQSIYEQLLRHNTSDMSGQDQSANDTAAGIACPLVFSSGNTVTFYVRPRLFLDIDLSGGISNMSTALGNALGISGNTFNSDLSGTKTEMFNTIFSADPSSAGVGYKWLAGRGDGHNSLSQWATNLAWDGDVSGESGNAIAMLDAHVWRINITLQ